MHAKPGAALQKRDDYLSLSLRQRIEGSSADYPLVAFGLPLKADVVLQEFI